MDIASYLLGKRAGGGGGKGSLKILVVEELPTTGEENVLYLVPRQVAKTRNVFDEYLYVNEAWELVGTTDIDISGKQDKMQFATMPSASSSNVGQIVQYIGTANANYTNGYFYICLSDGGDPATYSWENINVQESGNINNIVYLNGWDNSDETKAKIGKAITNGYNNKGVWIFWGQNISYGFAGYILYNTIYSKTTSYEFKSKYPLPYDGGSISFVTITGEWNNNVFNVTKVTGCAGGEQSLTLLTNNKERFIPKADFNPSTKIYADMVSILNANNIYLFDWGTKYNADDKVFSMYDKKYYKCIKTTQYNTPPNAEYWEEISLNVDELKLANKKYVDDAVAGSGGDITNLENRNFFVIKGFAGEDKQRLLDIINYSLETGIKPILAIKNGEPEFEGILLEPTNAFSINASQIYFTYSNTVSTIYGYDSSNSANVAHLKLTNLQWENNKLIDFSWAPDRYDRQFALSTTNIKAYTPTGNYNPSTKLYTDKTHYENMVGYDATKTQVLKNINGTLTWVDEE